MKALLKQLYFLFAPKPRLPSDRAVILMYHCITDRPDYLSAVTPGNFARQVAYIAEKKLPVISLGELVRRVNAREPLGGAVVLTFDDGYRDNYAVAFPILKKYNFPATIFVVTDLIGKRDKRDLERLHLDELRELHASGLIAIEPHTKTHPHLSRLSREQAREEIVGSKRFLEEALGKTCRFFATPYGDFNEETVGIIRESGFETANTVRQRTTAGDDIDLFMLPRVAVDYTTTFTQFKGKLSTTVDAWEKFKLWKR